MTCIVAIRGDDGLFLASERGCGTADLMQTLGTPKIWTAGGYSFGYSGDLFGETFRHNFKPPTITKHVDKFMQSTFKKAIREFLKEWGMDVVRDGDEKTTFSMIICVKGAIYEYDMMSGSLIKYDDQYMSIGSGQDFALGNLYATEGVEDSKSRAVMAVAAAIRFSPTCKEPIDVLEA